MFQDAYYQIGNAILAGQKINAVDVGGAGGLLAHWTKFQGNTKFHMYEPRESACEQLRQMYSTSPFASDFNLINTALSGTGGFRTLYITESQSSSSLLRPYINDERHKNYYGFTSYKEKLIRTKTLAESLSEEGVDTIEAIKLDTQGAELEILNGLDETRRDSLIVVETEVGLIDYYQGAPKLGDMLQFAENSGLDLFDMRTQRTPCTLSHTNETYNTKVFGVTDNDPSIASRLYEVDAIFFKKSSLALRGGPSQVRKLIFCLCVYNFFGEAINLALDAENQSVMTAQDSSQLVELVRMWHGVNRQVIAGYNQVLAATDNHIWGQYTWIPYPNM
jgi:FkbM family methyltransferase